MGRGPRPVNPFLRTPATVNMTMITEKTKLILATGARVKTTGRDWVGTPEPNPASEMVFTRWNKVGFRQRSGPISGKNSRMLLIAGAEVVSDGRGAPLLLADAPPAGLLRSGFGGGSAHQKGFALPPRAATEFV